MDRTTPAIVIAVVVIVGILLHDLFQSRRWKVRESSSSPGERLLAHSRDRDDYRMFVGVAPQQPKAWREVARIDGNTVFLSDGETLPLTDVTAYFVAYPSGELVDSCQPPNLVFPDWVKFISTSGATARSSIKADELTAGQRIVRVRFGRSTSEPGSRHHYSTTLTNVSAGRIRVLQFGGYARDRDSFRLNTHGLRLYTAAEFREWYGQKSDCLEPGQSATDANNYGTPPCLWAYFCENEDGSPFVTGAVIG